MASDPTTQTLAQLDLTTPESVAQAFAEVRKRFDDETASRSGNPDAWKQFVIAWTGRKSGMLSQITDNWLKSASKELKPAVGQELNKLKTHVEGVIEARRAEIEAAADQAAAARDAIDLSLPGVERATGTRHLIRQTYEELQRIFLSIGFSVVEGPEIETPYYNFEALNIPEHHPARDNMDTFYIEGSKAGHLLRTHTSPMQIRTMEKQKPPVRIVVPGKVYRRDNPDSTHGYMFHQIEGLAVDTDITFCDFKGTVEYFVREFLGPKAKTRLRPSYFPFTEPSAEVDATCHVCGGTGCRVCKFSGWIELFGAGMVDPAVYGFVGYDPEKLSGFAFGMGVDRLAMMKYGVSELPLLYQNDVRFLRQFP
ncbi:MAG TPA: phenylalanine--tRNA ligase subunit alpha [Candidatus Acidoferrum sp.]|jgi:phenylalanyl-tRNA synthetase alpha chain|nr:phenylalanine--tRNA ligase subunit alpha [Candidatus Acidoferrum sp.]